MGKLPFVVAPRANSRIEVLGSEISGKIEIERKGYLSVGEKAFMANVSGQDVVLKSVMRVSRAVSKKYGIDQQKAYDEVILAVTTPSECRYDISEDFEDDIADLANTRILCV